MIRPCLQHTERPLSCDTLIAFDGRGHSIFAKNSDRSYGESQPLESRPAATYPEGAYVRCQYLTIPQERSTFAVLGSRPWWLWGFEQGVNEAGVAIGNEAIYTRDDVPETGLLGMDLVRLGLERGATAKAAHNVIIDLLERYGQGGSAAPAPYKALYHNSFIIADAYEAYVLETSARRWVSKRVTTNTAIANLVTIEDDWNDASEGIEKYARDQGWWWGPSGLKMNFRTAFEDATMRSKTRDRYATSCAFLGSGEHVSVATIMRHLRDHFEGGTVHIPETPESTRPRSICCHPGRFASATAASMIVDLSPNSGHPPIAWCSMATPCSSVFLPVPVGVALPPAMVIGGEYPDTKSLWWAMREIADTVDADPAVFAPAVQEEWFPWEAELLEQTAMQPESAKYELNRRVDELMERRARLLGRCVSRSPRAAPVSVS